MASPVCPPGWTCTFHPPKAPEHVFDPWWTGPWGIVAAGAALLAAVIVVWIVSYYLHEAARSRRAAEENAQRRREAITAERERRDHERFLEEQRTMQLDAANGNPEVLRIVREMQER